MHRIRKMTVASLAALFLLFAYAADVQTSPGIAEVASFATLAPKATTLGKLLANPLLPPLLLSTMQQGLSSTYGHLRTDKPLFWVLSEPGVQEYDIPVLPLADGIAQFALNNPGSQRSDDSSVHLMVTAERPDETYAVFDRGDGYVAFASTVDDGRRALAATSAMRKAAHKNDGPVARVHVGEKSFASFTSSARGTNGVDVAKQVAGFDAELSLDDGGLTIEARFVPKSGVSPAALCAELEKSIGASLASLGAAEGVRPACRFTAGDKDVKAHIALPAEEMAKAGKAFNAAVVQALAPSTKPSKPAAGK